MCFLLSIICLCSHISASICWSYISCNICSFSRLKNNICRRLCIRNDRTAEIFKSVMTANFLDQIFEKFVINLFWFFYIYKWYGGPCGAVLNSRGIIYPHHIQGSRVQHQVLHIINLYIRRGAPVCTTYLWTIVLKKIYQIQFLFQTNFKMIFKEKTDHWKKISHIDRKYHREIKFSKYARKSKIYLSRYHQSIL